jgi:UDP-N-acetylmuramate dehydrogenase
VPEGLFEPRDEVEAARILAHAHACGIPVRVLGGGCNLLADDGPIPGVVVSTRRLTRREVGEDRVRVGAGYSFPRLVREALDLPIPALAGCPGIPGTVGGAVCMNAGGRHGNAGDAVLAIEGLEPDGSPFSRPAAPGDFGYRTSAFEGRLVTAAVFRRAPADRAALRALHEEALAHKRRTQPLSERSAGCIFRNPFPAGEGPSAGALVEAAGLKSLAVGGARVSERHANFIVTAPGARAADVTALIEAIREAVAARTGVLLCLEVRRWP